MEKPTIYLLECDNLSIFQQLQIEEALLRANRNNWCLLNNGSNLSIVAGISGRLNELLHIDKVINDQVPVVRRFSGGGTVVVDQNTFFSTFIINQDDIGVRAIPESIHEWAEKLYRNVFTDKDFRLRENDYVLEEKKFGGNAQYLCKDRWLHHTSFLWSFDPKNMEYLKMPTKMPKYRNHRNHCDFLCELSSRLSSKQLFFQRVVFTLNVLFHVKKTNIQEVTLLLDKNHRKTTKLETQLTKMFNT